jgi:hypothetical protein
VEIKQPGDPGERSDSAKDKRERVRNHHHYLLLSKNARPSGSFLAGCLPTYTMLKLDRRRAAL